MILFLYRKKDLFMFCECTCITSDIVMLHRLITKMQLSRSFVENTMFLFLRKTHKNSYKINKSQYDHVCNYSDTMLQIKIINDN